MAKYIFILGKNPELSKAEIKAVLPQAEIISESGEFSVLENEELDCSALMDRLGGTVKIGEVLGKEINEEQIVDLAVNSPSGKRFNFGFSFYGVKQDGIGMKIKKALKEKNISSRLVVSREKSLSSVIVTKEKCRDFLVLPGFFGLTGVVQDFKEYGLKDFGRPASDPYSGMLPPKVAKMMINLSGLENFTLLDPFCGSGTILMEAAFLGVKKIFGSDISEKAVSDAVKNLDWLKHEFNLDFDYEVRQRDVKNLCLKEKADGIVTEPYLGPAIRGGEDILSIRNELSVLYLSAFKEFVKVLNSGGRVVIVFPEWHLNEVVKLDIFSEIEKLGFRRLDLGDLIYHREKQKVWRQITIWEYV